MSATLTELDLIVGSLITTRPEEDLEIFEEEQVMVLQVQDQLAAEGIEIDLTCQPGVEVWEGGIESIGALYQLSRLAIHLEQGHDVQSILEDGPVIYADDLDTAVTSVWQHASSTRFPHLINLQGFDSYYLPIDFAQPLWFPFHHHDVTQEQLDHELAFFGSTIALQRELIELAPLLQQAGIPTRSAAYQCFSTLQQAVVQSLHYGLPIIIW
ncbi:MAG: hypothetical protein HC837_05910 [Chloroflexaceae bacterium]|nr:hypothetical protein [Chloroflexaceae bacterium]